ncbi:hypothetical protein LJC03_06125, partial [Methanobrevibacter sp. OttesenSCG-928-I08]|nr:hypothetical protein [Methanobrevibacter sp. OttesenSCG-928-I08]
MNFFLIAIFYSLSGFFMKYSDDEYDENSNKLKAVILGIICGLVTGFVSTINQDAACIFIAVLLANLIALKVDGIHHLATLITFVGILVLLGFPVISFFTLVICIIGAFIDEIGNDNDKLYSKGKFFKYFFEYRFTLKVVIFILAISGF